MSSNERHSPPVPGPVETDGSSLSRRRLLGVSIFLIFVLPSAFGIAGQLSAADCNENGVDDTLDLRPGELRLEAGGTVVVSRGSGGRVLPADMDGDGTQDLIVGLTVFLNDGGGGFALASAPEGILTSMASFAVGDFDGDGDPDLAAGHRDPSTDVLFISTLLNDGAGTLSRPASSSPAGPQGVRITAAAPGDLDGDGHLDLVITHEPPMGLSVLFNRGDGTLDPAVELSDDRRWLKGWVLPQDLDADGALDLAVVRRRDLRSAVLQLFFNAGDRTFMEPMDLELANWPSSIAAGDLDSDGDLDLVMVVHIEHKPWRALDVLRNVGRGTFAPAEHYEYEDTAEFYGEYLDLGDLDGDGALDVVVCGPYPTDLYVLRNEGDGTLNSPIRFEGDGGSPVIVNLDTDGDLDLLTSAGIHFNTGDGTLGPPTPLPPLGAPPSGTSALRAEISTMTGTRTSSPSAGQPPPSRRSAFR